MNDSKISSLEEENRRLREELKTLQSHSSQTGSSDKSEENIHLKQALYDKHELLMNVTNSITDLLFYKDTDYRYTGCNQAFSDFLGLPIDFIIGKTDYELFDAEYADLFRSMDKRVIEGLGTFSNYEWIKHADGRRLYVLTQKSPLFDTKADLIGMVGIARDLTKEQHLEEELKKSNEHLIDAQSIAKVGHWEWDIINDKLVWSNEIYKIFGYIPEEFTANLGAFTERIHPDDREMVASAIDQALDDHTDYDIYHRILLPDGEEKIVHECGHAVYDNDKAIHMIGTVQDVTKLTRIQKELEEHKEAFETIFEQSMDANALIENGKYTACNQGMLKIMGYASKKELLKKHPAELSPEFQPDGQNSDEKIESYMEQCLNEGSCRFQWYHIRKSGEYFWMDVVLTRLNINNQTIIHFSGRDYSQQKDIENRLGASNKEYQTLANDLDQQVKQQSIQMIKQSRMAQMGELLSMIAHQWRQPLSSVSSITSAVKIRLSLAENKNINEEVSRYLNTQMNTIDELTQSLSNTIDDFRTLYKPDKLMRYYKINVPIERALKLLEASFIRQKINIKKAYNEDVNLLMHGNEVMQVILNILKNAEDNFLETEVDSPFISIHTSIDEFTVKIIICDNGGGIKESEIDNIFDPYFSTKDEKNGTGLGLYMSKIIIEQHHKGELLAYNSELGACFEIRLPIL